MKGAMYLLVALGAGSTGTACGQVALGTDIGVTLTASPTTGVAPGQRISFTLTVANYGPLPAPVLILDSSMFTNQISGFVTNPDECYLVATIVDGTVSSSYVSWFVAGLPGSPDFGVGETLTCHFQFSLSADAPIVWPFSFAVSTYNPDLNPSNDVGTVTLRQRIASVPALSSITLMLLAALLVGFSAARFTRKAQR